VSSSTGASHPITPFWCGLVSKFRTAARPLFWVGIFLFIVGCLTIMHPGSGDLWFTTAAVLAAFGFLVPRWGYRTAALAFFVLSAYAAFDCYRAGIKYRQQLEHGRSVFRSQ